jgi:hypothetical protein
MKNWWSAKLVERDDTPQRLLHAGDLRGGDLGIDDTGTIWECYVTSGICNTGTTKFGAKNIGYPSYYHKEGEGPSVRILRNPIVTVEES